MDFTLAFGIYSKMGDGSDFIELRFRSSESLGTYTQLNSLFRSMATKMNCCLDKWIRDFSRQILTDTLYDPAREFGYLRQ
jgi:hypothetical protein